jgi:hypothetical protein
MKSRLFTFGCAVLAILAMARSAGAQVTPAAGSTPPDDTQSIKIGAVIFYDWTRQIEPKGTDAAGNTVTLNSFNVSRTYINVTGNISHLLAFRITPDITRETGAGSTLNGSLTFRLKYGYAQFNLDEWTKNWRQTYARLGQQQTLFIDTEEGVYRYRFQGTVFAERDAGMSSADAGAAFHTNFPKGFGDVAVGVFNGEGYSKVEVNDQKSVQFRATVRPMPGGSLALKGLRITGFVLQDHGLRNAERSRAIGSVWYEHRWLNAGFDYITATDQALPTVAKINQNGWSVFVTPFFHEKGNGWEALIRYDSYVPDKTNNTFDGSTATRNRTIAGVAYWFPHPGGAGTAALMLDYEQVKFDHFAPTAATATQKKLFLHGLINF